MSTPRAARGFLSLAAAGIAVFLVAELVLDLTAWGQTWDDSALLEARLLPEAVWDTCDSLLRIIRIPSIVVVLAACIAIAAARRQLLTGFVAVMSFGAAIVAAEAIKFITPRPDLVPDLTFLVDNAGANTFPSGHATIATALGMGLILVASPRWRPWVAAAVFVFTSLMACSTVIAGWHRPSDAIGGMAFATAWMALGGWLLARLRAAPVAQGDSRLPVILSLGWAALATAAIMILSLTTSSGFLAAFATAEITIIAIAGAAVGAYALTLRRVDFISR